MSLINEYLAKQEVRRIKRDARFAIKPPKPLSLQQRIADIKADAKDRVKELEAEVFHILQQLLDREIPPADADHKVWLLRDDIATIKETARLDIQRIKES